MSLHTLRILARLVGEGMVLVGQRPLHTLGLCDGEKENEFAALVQRVWQHPNVHEGKDLQTIFNRLGVSPDFVYHLKQEIHLFMLSIINKKEPRYTSLQIVSERTRKERLISG